MHNKNTLFEHLLDLASSSREKVDAAVKYLDSNWEPGDEFLVLEMLRFTESEYGLDKSLELMGKKTGLDFGPNPFPWWQHYWNQENPKYSKHFADFKGFLYKNIDPKFEKYFKDRQETATIRLDEIVWGGVVQDGIPPLRYPKMISADEATYLEDDNVVFGFALNGVVRAYPKRILAWHEFFVDDFGDLSIAGVYCTLCGTVIAYDMTVDGVRHDLGTSGFLYRSNKLMYDKETQSMWNTVEGRPVLGPLADKDIVLNTHYLVTTTWGEWKKLHPNTEVLSLDTGHRRDYGEGVAYHRYFGTDELMFPVPQKDIRLKNKAEVFVIREKGYTDDPLAISAEYLDQTPIVHETVGDTKVVVLTDKSGNRAYEDVFENNPIASFDEGVIKLANGQSYEAKEDGIYNGDEKVARRLSSHRIFWFAWFNTFPNTRLVQ